MPVPAAKVKAVCSEDEAALVRASRKPHLEQHAVAEIKKLAARARKLFDKWHDQSRTQARGKSRSAGFGEAAANTALKADIFRHALESFEARLAKLVKSGSAKPAAKTVSKRERSAEHRATRAGVRDELKQEKLARAEKTRKAKAKVKAKAKPVEIPPAEMASAEATAPPLTPPKPKKSTKPAPLSAHPQAIGLNPKQQLKATTAAKQARVQVAGKLTRSLGHTTARGKRKQAARDSRNK